MWFTCPVAEAVRMSVHRDVMEKLKHLTGASDCVSADERAREATGDAPLLLEALDNCWYEGWNNGFCNVSECFADPSLVADPAGNAAEALRYLAEYGIPSARNVFDALYRPTTLTSDSEKGDSDDD